MIDFENTLQFARQLDGTDPLRSLRDRFHFPKAADGSDAVYLCGNSLGLQPKRTAEYVNEMLGDWASLGVEGHFKGERPFVPYHERLTEPMSRIVGATPLEVVVMNSLTVNLHLMMVSFYRPEGTRFKVLMEAGAFPSDQYAIASQVRFHGYDPADAIIEMKPRDGEVTLRTEDIVERIEREGASIALVLFGNVNYLTGQAFDMPAITRAGHRAGCVVGFDLAHAAGNLPMSLHDWNVDFAVWCNYKYINGGPGTTAGCFVHERHARRTDLPRFAGWWGQDKSTRFLMGPQFNPIVGAEGWQLSCQPTLLLASLRASLELFDSAGMPRLREKSLKLTGYLEFLLDQIPGAVFTAITPKDPAQRGCQLSLRAKIDGRELLRRLNEAGVICDFREPDVVRVAPAPLYNSFEDVYRFAQICSQVATVSSLD